MRLIDVDTIEYHEDDAVYRHEIEAMPTVEPKTGHWMIRSAEDWMGRPTGKHFLRCDQCGEEVVIPFGKIPFNYCPNCGAKMEVEDEDTLSMQ